ncbi:MAG: glycosyltransferase family 2 protein [Solirubrobacteraceae bacterium]
MREPGLLSVVAPMHDEEDMVGAFHARTVAALDGIEFELLLVDDGSRDRTGERLRALAAADDRIKLISLSRNFGHQAAISAGLEHARGDVVVMIDGDLQDPPELIPEMLAAWRRGADVVYAVRESREGETRFKLTTARWFYRLFAKLARIELAHDAGDFRLMDRAPLEALLSMPERNRFLRGMTVWVGFTQTAVSYRREARADGESKFTPARMLRLAFDAITSFSHAPLQAATLLGFVFSILAFLAIPLTVVARYADIYSRGVPTTIVIILLLGGIQLITVGIIGEYVGRIYDEVKHRPLYVVRERVNVEAPDRPERAGTT